jgi:hypothetical protein
MKLYSGHCNYSSSPLIIVVNYMWKSWVWPLKTRAIDKHDERYSLENVNTDWNIIVSVAWELGHEKCRVGSVGSRRILMNTTVKLQATIICRELPAQLSNHQLLKVRTAPWSNLVRNSLLLPLSVLPFSYFQIVRGLG